MANQNLLLSGRQQIFQDFRQETFQDGLLCEVVAGRSLDVLIRSQAESNDIQHTNIIHNTHPIPILQ